MFVGKVVGTVWSTVKWPGLNGLKLLLVKPFELGDLIEGAGPRASDADGVVVADTLDAGVGDTDVVAFGHAARVAIAPEIALTDKPPHPIDAAVVAIVDDMQFVEAE